MRRPNRLITSSPITRATTNQSCDWIIGDYISSSTIKDPSKPYNPIAAQSEIANTSRDLMNLDSAGLLSAGSASRLAIAIALPAVDDPIAYHFFTSFAPSRTDP
jgi:hypothetical protein